MLLIQLQESYTQEEHEEALHSRSEEETSDRGEVDARPPSDDSGPNEPPDREIGSSIHSRELVPHPTPPSDDSGPDEPSDREIDSSIHSGELIPHPTPPSDDSGPDEEEEEEEDNFRNLFETFSMKWTNTQVTHSVSLSAANSFWMTAMEFIPRLMELKRLEGVKHKIPQFLQVQNTSKIKDGSN